MTENIFDKALISDEEWEKVKISRVNTRPNAKSSYGTGSYTASDTKALFDKQGELLKKNHNELVESLKNVGEAESKREEEFNRAQTLRQVAFEQAQSERNSEWSEELANRQKVFDDFFDSLDIITEPGETDPKVMSEETTKKYVEKYSEDYIPKVATRNLADLTFENATIKSSTGVYTIITTGINYAASPDYIEVVGGETYTLSRALGEISPYTYVHMYDSEKVWLGKFEFSFSSTKTLTVADNCQYVRFFFYRGQDESWEKNIPSDLQFEAGSVATEYIPPMVISSDIIAVELEQKLGNSIEKAISQKVVTQEVEGTKAKVEGLSDSFISTVKMAYTTGECNIATNTQVISSFAVGYAIPIKKSNFPTKCTGVSMWITSNFTELDIVVELLDANLNLIQKLAEDRIELTSGIINNLYAKYYTATCDFYREQIETEVAYIRIYIPNTTADYEGRINLGGLTTYQTSDEIDVSVYPCYYQVVGRDYLSKDMSASGVNEPQKKLIELKTQSYELASRQTSYEAYGLPVLEFEGDISSMNKDNAVTLAYSYGDRTGSCTLKWQGSSSIAYPKKNYTVKFDSAFEAKEGWGEQKKYCLKANYIDFSHSRNICCAKLWGGVVKSRTPANATLNALPNAGAIDGFPICVVINGEYQGIYTFNIPKDKWMFGMGNEASTEKMAIMNADASDATGLQICTFKSANATGTDADIEIEYVTDEDNPQWAIDSINDLIQACIDCNSEADFDANVAPYLDVESAIDYYILCLILRNFDGISKNYLLVTYDGTKWFFSAYDMDSTFGLWFDGSKFTRVNGYSVDNFAQQHRVFELIKTYKADKLKARYNELVNDALSEETVIETFTNFIGSIPKALLDEEVKIWNQLPSTSVNNISQIIDFNRRRRAYIDPQIKAL